MSISRMLLREALAALGRCQNPEACLPDETLLARIVVCLDGAEPPHPAIAIARARWAMVSFLRVDPDERRVEMASDGVWVRGWIKVGEADGHEISPDVARRYERAVNTLPKFTRRIFAAHRVEGLDIATIAHRYGITKSGVETLIVDALAAVARYMRNP